MNRYLIYSSFILVQALLTTQTDPLNDCPISLPRSWNVFAYTDTCLELVHGERSWYDARNHCKQLGGDLVVIQDMAKQQFIMNILKSLRWDRYGVWIGGTDNDKEGEWKWVTGDSITWSYWRSGQGSDSQPGFLFPKGALEDCAQMRTDDFYKWHDYPCSGGIGYHYSSICEYKRTKVYSIQTVTFNMLSTTTIQIPTTNRETTPPNRETPPPTRETTPPNRETPPLTRETTPPNRETPPPNRETPSPNRETPAPTHPGK